MPRRITVALPGQERVALRVLPHFDVDEIGHEGRDLAFHDGRVAADDVLVVGLDLVRLGDN